MYSLEALIEQRKELENKIQKIKNYERTSALANIKALIEQHEFDVYDIFDTVEVKIKPRFLNPETGETWAGRGKTPRWLVGKDKELFKIKNESNV